VSRFQEWVAAGCPDNWNHYLWDGRRVNPLRQREFFCGPDGEVLVDHIGRFEELDVDFPEVCDLLGISAHLPHSQQTTPTDYRTFYDAASILAVTVIGQWEIERFGYEF